MRRFLAFIFIILVLQGCCAIPKMVTRVPASYEFVGEINLGEVVWGSQSIRIPVSFSGGEWINNSALVPCNLNAWIKGHTIFIQVSRCVASNASCFNSEYFELKDIELGLYKVVYLEPSGEKKEIGNYSYE